MHRQAPARWRPRLDELVDELDLAEFLATPVRNLSLGQRMRGELAAALLHRPELVVLDEPTIGLDMVSKEKLRSFLQRELTERGTTLLLTTHDMGDVQRLCQRLLVIDRGRLVFDGSADDLARHTGAERVLVLDCATEVPTDLRLPHGPRVVAREGTHIEVAFGSGPTTNSGGAALTSAAAVLEVVGQQVQVVDLHLSEPEIESLVRRLYT